MKKSTSKARTPVKYPLKVGRNVLSIPGGPEGMHFQLQRQVPKLWTNAVLGGEEQDLIIYVAKTGETLPIDADYIGTATCPVDGFEFHAYTLTE